jgi:hypothetical protein
VQVINPQEKQGKTMRMKAVLQTVGGSIALAVALNVCAQPGVASAPTSGALASSSAKEVKAANKKLRRDVLRALAKADLGAGLGKRSDVERFGPRGRSDPEGG